MEIEITSDDEFDLVFEVDIGRDSFDHEFGEQVYKTYEAIHMMVYSKSGDVVQLSKEDHRKYFNEYKEEAEDDAREAEESNAGTL